MARCTQTELIALREAVEQLVYWYDRAVVLEFLSAVGPHDRRFSDALSKLARFKTEPGSTT